MNEPSKNIICREVYVFKLVLLLIIFAKVVSMRWQKADTKNSKLIGMVFSLQLTF